MVKPTTPYTRGAAAALVDGVVHVIDAVFSPGRRVCRAGASSGAAVRVAAVRPR